VEKGFAANMGYRISSIKSLYVTNVHAGKHLVAACGGEEGYFYRVAGWRGQSFVVLIGGL